ncbi:MAG: carbohydrate kinase [Lentisphaeria bacterium]|nr:carbohydrate kinase [Lentisphaeria bacterium]NQZ70651.1 carbohydrate kinase [Lentisphaeria bacterium]
MGKYQELAAALRSFESSEKPAVTVGFDGFIDTMITVVDERKSLNDWQPMDGIPQLADWISQAAGRSALREIVIQGEDAGGCAVNLGDGLIALDLPVHCYATLGAPMHNAFQDFATACHSCISWGTEHGKTLAFEFDDGKIMFCATSQLAELDPSLLADVLSDGKYQASCAASSTIVLTNWTLYPHMTDCWNYLIENVYSKLEHRPRFMIDLVDPSGRTDADIIAMLNTLPAFEPCGPVTLNLNGSEGNTVALCLGIAEAADELEPVLAQSKAIREKLNIDEVTIHCIKFAASSTAQASEAMATAYAEKPKKSTGAGDRFNAGYTLGHILELPMDLRLLCGGVCSGFFVRNARSGSIAELAEFADSQ